MIKKQAGPDKDTTLLSRARFALGIALQIVAVFSFFYIVFTYLKKIQ